MDVLVEIKENIHLFAFKYFKEKCTNLETHSEDYDFYDALLKCEVETVDDEFRSFISKTNRYPMYPLYRTLSFNLLQFIKFNNSLSPNKHLENVSHIDVIFNNELIDKIDEIHKSLTSFNLLLSDDTDDPVQFKDNPKLKELETNVTALFNLMKKSEIRKLLGLVKTIGSLELLPPQLFTLWQSFCKIHHPKSKITVAARALSKHCHRSSDSWWGMCTGTEENKNKQALDVFKRIFSDICWINIHILPHDVRILEVRCGEWYGLRWSHDGTFFRGFLEPQMADGHETKWKH